MEDISRDLAREIANARPRLPKKSKKQHILILSQEGKIRSGWYLGFFNRLLLVMMAICISIGLALYYMYNNMQEKNLQIVQELDDLGTTYQELLHERETLMARVVMMKKNTQKKPTKKKIKQKPKVIPTQRVEEKTTEDVAVKLPKFNEINNKKQTEKVTPSNVSMVKVQKFSIAKDSNKETVNINFDIRNISKNGQDISGSIFAVLKPKQGNYQDWVVIPKSPMKNGMPEMPEKGQTFTISSFKPVQLELKTDKAINFFLEASIFVFDKNKNLIIESVFAIDQSTTNVN